MAPKKPTLPKGIRERLARARARRPTRPTPRRIERPVLPRLPAPPDTSRASQRARAQADRAAAARDQLVARMRERRAVLRGRAPRPPAREPSRRRWVYLALLLFLLLSLLCLRDCNCTPIETGPPAPPTPPVVAPEPEPEPPPVPLGGRVKTQERPAFVAPPPRAPAWLDRFRMQVAARSPRLSKCFEGQAAPGTLKWTTAVEPGSGLTSGHSLEPTLESAELSSVERDCVLGVLTDPPYALPEPGPDDPSTPSRVSLVLEF
jgi:hypothetical protein